MCKTKMAVLASVLASLLLLTALPASAGLAGWQYQREIAVQENSGETLRDYQVLVALAGSDFPEEAQPDGDDIRFTDADGRELSYWIEEFDAGSKRAAIWVKVPLIPANGEARIVMWYGNPGAESGSDGEAVFEFFDDFEDGIIGDDWAIISGSFTESGGILKSNTANPAVIKNNIKLKNLAICSRMKTASGDYAGYVWRMISDTTYYYLHTNLYEVRKWPSKTTIISYTAVDKTEYHNYETRMFDDSIAIYIDGSLKGSGSDSPSIGVGNQGFRSWSAIGNWDWVFVRAYTSPEPTVTITPSTHATQTALTIAKSPSPHSIRQFQETTITISIENSGTTDATDIEITDTIHPSFDLTSGDFPNPKRYDLIRPGETRDLQYTISAKESGTFTLDSATVTYADEDGNIQEATSEPASIKVIPSTEGSTAGGTSRSNPSVSTASVQLHGEKTSVVLGEDILLKLSAVNLITKPTMHVQVIIIPPSGMSVTSSAFAKSGAGQYTTTYELEPGSGKDIEVAIRSNQVGDFEVNGRIIYYFGNDREDAEDHTLTLPITVRAEPEQMVDMSGSKENGSSTPGFGAMVAVIGVLLVALLIKRRKLR